jgi:phenylpyruvate tautomerase PptA (4-oxalocrotonate tautomerase family)
MPVLEISTNTTISNKQEIVVKASELCAELLGKPNKVPPVSEGSD